MKKKRSELIGRGDCPVCTRATARFTLSSANLVVCTCPAPPDGCGIQLFARSDESDAKLRERIAAPGQRLDSAGYPDVPLVDTAKVGDADVPTAKPGDAGQAGAPIAGAGDEDLAPGPVTDTAGPGPVTGTDPVTGDPGPGPVTGHRKKKPTPARPRGFWEF